MTCCNKTVPKVKRIVEQNAEAYITLGVLNKFMDAIPEKLNDKMLLDYHHKTHMLYEGNIKKRPLNKNFINSIVKLHDKFVDEMLKRNMKHSSPLSKI